jgi:hypothetical protein
MALFGRRTAATPLLLTLRTTAVLLLSAAALLSSVSLSAAPPPAPASGEAARPGPAADPFTSARPGLPERGAVDREIKRVLSRKEFRKRGPSLIEQFREWLLKLLEKLGFRMPNLQMSRGGGEAVQFVVLVLAVCGFLFLIYYAVRYGARRLQEEQIGPDRGSSPGGTETPESYLRQAEVLAANGDYRTALEKAYLGTLLFLGNGKAMEFHPHRTNWENLRTLNRTFPAEPARTLRRLSRVFDRKWYGLEEASAEEYRRAAEDLARVRAALAATAGPSAAPKQAAEVPA